MVGASSARSSDKARIASAAAAALIHIALGYGLLLGLGSIPGSESPRNSEPMLLIELAPPPAPIPPARPSRSEPGSHTTRNADIAAPEGVAIDSVAHVPELSVPPFRLPTPSIPAGGGIAEGDGLGSEGDGSGGAGTGAGAGGGDAEDFTEARQIRGRFRNSDFPESAEGATPLRVGVRFAVGPAGRVDQCEIIAPSGYPELDAMTCRVIIDRYRFRPARDGQGVAVTEVMEEAYTWVSHDRVRTQN